MAIYGVSTYGGDTYSAPTFPASSDTGHVRRFEATVTIDGVDTPFRSIRTAHDVDQPIATGHIVLAAPREVQVQPAAEIVITAGYDGEVHPIFSGRLTDDVQRFDERGGELRVDIEGWSRILFYKNDENVGFSGPMSLNVWWRSLCNWREVPYYHADATTDTDGNTIMLGDNPDIDGGWLAISTQRSPGSDMARIARLFGYRHFDTPSGMVRLQKVSGLPTESWEDVPQYIEGQSVLSVERTQSLSAFYNYVEVWGAEYQAADTSEVAIRSFGTPVTADDRLGPSGVNALEIRDDSLTTVALADAARNAHEIDHGSVQYRYRWSCVGGDGEREPGEQVAVLSSTVNGPDGVGLIAELVQILPRSLWVMRVEHDISDRGWRTTMEGWAGLGQALPAGDDCTTQTLMSGSVHLGNEYLWHYRNESPNGNVSTTQHDIAFTLAENYSTATIRAQAHGCNSFLFSTNTEASRFEIWQGGERKASGEMPRVNEYLSQRYDYNQDTHWADIVVPLTGSLDAGSATLRIIAGKDHDINDTDDFEVKGVTLTTCGIGEPVVIS